jgi:hypothetical protein
MQHKASSYPHTAQIHAVAASDRINLPIVTCRPLALGDASGLLQDTADIAMCAVKQPAAAR